MTLKLKNLHQLIEFCELKPTTEQMNIMMALVADLLGQIEQLSAPIAKDRDRERDRQATRRVRLGVSQAEWADLRTAVFKRDDYCCQYCGSNMGPFSCDHVIPLAAGGETKLENLVTACKDCNSSKRDRPLTEWEARLWQPPS